MGCEIAESMDILQFCDRTDELYYEAEPGTNLKQMRKNSGLSQSELAELPVFRCEPFSSMSSGRKTLTVLRWIIWSASPGLWIAT